MLLGPPGTHQIIKLGPYLIPTPVLELILIPIDTKSYIYKNETMYVLENIWENLF